VTETRKSRIGRPSASLAVFDVVSAIQQLAPTAVEGEIKAGLERRPLGCGKINIPEDYLGLGQTQQRNTSFPLWAKGNFHAAVGITQADTIDPDRL
jgi:hypothetical protein